jgi:hypothetical protein
MGAQEIEAGPGLRAVVPLDLWWSLAVPADGGSGGAIVAAAEQSGAHQSAAVKVVAVAVAAAVTTTGWGRSRKSGKCLPTITDAMNCR